MITVRYVKRAFELYRKFPKKIYVALDADHHEGLGLSIQDSSKNDNLFLKERKAWPIPLLGVASTNDLLSRLIPLAQDYDYGDDCALDTIARICAALWVDNKSPFDTDPTKKKE